MPSPSASWWRSRHAGSAATIAPWRRCRCDGRRERWSISSWLPDSLRRIVGDDAQTSAPSWCRTRDARVRGVIEGLSSPEAARRLRVVGPNEPAPPPHRFGVAAVFAFLANPLAVILLAASAVSAAPGDAVNAPLHLP